MKNSVKRKKYPYKIFIIIFVSAVLLVDILLFIIWQKNNEIKSVSTVNAVKNESFDYKREEKKLKKALTTTETFTLVFFLLYSIA